MICFLINILFELSLKTENHPTMCIIHGNCMDDSSYTL
jgi:hypothetical protein